MFYLTPNIGTLEFFLVFSTSSIIDDFEVSEKWKSNPIGLPIAQRNVFFFVSSPDTTK
jgi:hypothetical protein